MGAVSVDEVLDRFTDQVEVLDGFREFEGVFDPADAPANYAEFPFAVDPPASANTQQLRDREGVIAMELTSRMVVRFYAPLHTDGQARKDSIRAALRAERRVIRKLMTRGDAWMHGLRIFYLTTEREQLAGEWLRLAVAFDVEHFTELT